MAPSATPDCPFCEVAPERVFHEGRLVRGLWDGFPVSPGHALLMPRRHVATWFDASDDERRELAEAIEPAREAILLHHRPDGFNIGMNLGAASPSRRSSSRCSRRAARRPVLRQYSSGLISFGFPSLIRKVCRRDRETHTALKRMRLPGDHGRPCAP